MRRRWAEYDAIRDAEDWRHEMDMEQRRREAEQRRQSQPRKQQEEES